MVNRSIQLTCFIQPKTSSSHALPPPIARIATQFLSLLFPGAPISPVDPYHSYHSLTSYSLLPSSSVLSWLLLRTRSPLLSLFSHSLLFSFCCLSLSYYSSLSTSHLLSPSPTVHTIGYYPLMSRECILSCSQYKVQNINFAGKYIHIPSLVLSDRLACVFRVVMAWGRLGGPDESPISSLSPIAHGRSTPKVHDRIRGATSVQPTRHQFIVISTGTLYSLIDTSCASAAGNGGASD